MTNNYSSNFKLWFSHLVGIVFLFTIILSYVDYQNILNVTMKRVQHIVIVDETAADAAVKFSRVENLSEVVNNTKQIEKDTFVDLSHILSTLEVTGENETYKSVIIRLESNSYNPTIGELMNMTLNETSTIFDEFQMSIRKQELYFENDPLISELLYALSTTPIDDLEQQPHGTQFKFVLYFENGGKALSKPMRYSREQDTLPNHMYFADFERHTSEIATFHLDRILGYRRAAPVVGRKLNLTEIESMADDELRETFFESPANNKCFYGNCTYYCDAEHAFCGNGDIIEASVVAYLPLFDDEMQIHWRSPWRRSYHKRLRAQWRKNPNYCDDVVKEDPIYVSGRRILDVMDMVALDFLIGNQDRHHYETFSIFGNDSSILHIDHGRGFGRPNFDDMVILTPIRHCCIFRDTTLKTLLDFHNGPKPLSQRMRESLAQDPLAPILMEPHLVALDRRVGIILETIRKCTLKDVKTSNKTLAK